MSSHKITAALAVLLTLCVAPSFARSTHKASVEDLEFGGHFRAEAKTSYAPGPTEECRGLSEVMNSLVTDQRMLAKYPELRDKKSNLTDRVDQELRNICVEAYLYAAKLERGRHGDNDFHLILGSSTVGEIKFFTAEVSGVPQKGDKSAFKRARHQVLKILGKRRLNSRYIKFRKPIKVRVEGSLFFDADHVAGQVGPKYAKPKTVWEIHPVKSIEKISPRTKTAKTTTNKTLKD